MQCCQLHSLATKTASSCQLLLSFWSQAQPHLSKQLALVQVKDRALVGKRMKEHVADPSTTPLLIFPEGTCVNNEYCVMFKRGAFDLGAVSGLPAAGSLR